MSFPNVTSRRLSRPGRFDLKNARPQASWQINANSIRANAQPQMISELRVGLRDFAYRTLDSFGDAPARSLGVRCDPALPAAKAERRGQFVSKELTFPA